MQHRPTDWWLAALTVFYITVARGQASPGADAIFEQTNAVDWRATSSAVEPVSVHLVGFNDLHGRLSQPPGTTSKKPAHVSGGAAVLAAYLETEREALPKRTLTLIAGDSWGASTLMSSALHEEPTLSVLNALADGDCPTLQPYSPPAATFAVTRCRIIATLGEHELEGGSTELARLLYGAVDKKNSSPTSVWGGAHVPFISANILHADTLEVLLPAAIIVDLDGIRIGVIGAITEDAPTLLSPGRIADLAITTAATAVNTAVQALHAQGVNVIVLVIHEGLTDPITLQTIPRQLNQVHGGLKQVLEGIHGGVDVVIAGHTHALNAVLLPLADGSMTLVTQARMGGSALSSIDLTIDRRTGKVTAKSARLITTWADDRPGQKPVKKIAHLVAAAEQATAATSASVLNHNPMMLLRGKPSDAASSLGFLLADAARTIAGTDFAFVDANDIRDDLLAGPITKGSLFAVQPSNHQLIKITLDGEQIYRLLEQQWHGNERIAEFLRVSGLTFTYDNLRLAGHHVDSIKTASGDMLERTRTYTVAASDVLSAQGSRYGVLSEGKNRSVVAIDLAATEQYIRQLADPIAPPAESRAHLSTERPH